MVDWLIDWKYFFAITSPLSLHTTYFLSIFCVLKVLSISVFYCSPRLLNLVHFDPPFKLSFELRIFPCFGASSWPYFHTYIFKPSLKLYPRMCHYAFGFLTLQSGYCLQLSRCNSHGDETLEGKNEQFCLCKRKDELFRNFWLWNYAGNFHSCPSNRWKIYLLIRQMPLKSPAFRF